MTRSFVRIVADDLTGALDAAAPFATPARPVRLLLAGQEPRSAGDLAGVTVSSESRELGTAAGNKAVDTAMSRAEAADAPDGRLILAFAKVDSVLRGRPVSETLLKMRHLGAQTCVFAPAFPEMGRRTLDGHHEISTENGWQAATVCDLRAAFRAFGFEAIVRPPGGADSESGIIIGDAETAEDLADHAMAFRDHSNLLWAGSRGLAQALAGVSTRQPTPAIGAVVVGTTHLATRRQVERGSARGLFDACRLIDPVPNAADAAETRKDVRNALGDLLLPEGEAIFVVGGETLAVVLAALDVEYLDCVGEVAPGVPAGRLVGGRFDGHPIITKSGGFGGPDLIVDLLDSK